MLQNKLYTGSNPIQQGTLYQAGGIMYNGIMYMQTTRKLGDQDKVVFKFLNTPRLQQVMAEINNCTCATKM